MLIHGPSKGFPWTNISFCIFLHCELSELALFSLFVSLFGGVHKTKWWSVFIFEQELLISFKRVYLNLKEFILNSTNTKYFIKKRVMNYNLCWIWLNVKSWHDCNSCNNSQYDNIVFSMLPLDDLHQWTIPLSTETVFTCITLISSSNSSSIYLTQFLSNLILYNE